MLMIQHGKPQTFVIIKMWFLAILKIPRYYKKWQWNYLWQVVKLKPVLEMCQTEN